MTSTAIATNTFIPFDTPERTSPERTLFLRGLQQALDMATGSKQLRPRSNARLVVAMLDDYVSLDNNQRWADEHRGQVIASRYNDKVVLLQGRITGFIAALATRRVMDADGHLPEVFLAKD